LPAFDASAPRFWTGNAWGGLPIARLDRVELLEAVLEHLNACPAKGPLLLATLDALGARRADTDGRYREALLSMDIVVPDGMGLVWALNRIERRKPADYVRNSGCDFVEALCLDPRFAGRRVYFLGGRPGVARAAQTRLLARGAPVTFAGCHHGYFDPGSAEHILADLRRREIEVLFLGLGAPRQEQFLADHAKELPPCVAMGVGGSFDVIAGRLKRAPELWQKSGMEWLWRLVQEPGRLRRDLGLLGFAASLLLHGISRR